MRRPRAVLLSALLTLGLVAVSACGGNTPPADQTSGDPNQGLGEAPSTSPTPSTTPGPGAPPPANNPPAPHSTMASKVGYVWADQPASTYTASTAYQYNSGGGAIDITHTATGAYQVRFVGLADPGGVAHAQAYGHNSNYCAVMSWSDAGSDENVSVRCYDAGGSPTDSTFTANFAVGSMGAARFSYLWADQQGTAKYKPRAEYRYDAVSSSGITVQRTNAGRYEVFLPASGPQLPGAWTFQVTAHGSATQCKLAGFSASNRKAQVACRNAAGSFQDTRFALTFASSGSFVGRTDRPYGAFSEANDGVENPSTGNYSIRVPGLGQDKGQAVAVARGTFSTYCHAAGWNAAGADLDVDIVCFNPGGAAASSSFELAVTL